MTAETYVDPFADAEKHPAVSFRDKPAGFTVIGKVIAAPKLAQGRNFDTREPDTWPDGNPKMAVVTEIEVNGEILALWAPKPSAMFTAMAEAQKTAGASIAVGGMIKVVFTHEVPNAAKPHLNPQKQYQVTYKPPDPWATAEPAGKTAPPQDEEPPF